jgi:hypothetical protein
MARFKFSMTRPDQYEWEEGMMIMGNDDGGGSEVGGELPADLLGDGVLLGLDEGLEYASDGGFDVFLGHF